MGAVILWAWDETNKIYRKVLVDDSGKLIISDADPFEIKQITASNLKHMPHGYYYTGEAAMAFATDSVGRLLITLSNLAHLNDIDDVYVPTPTDEYLLYWDDPNSRWACRALVAGDIPNISAAKLTSGELPTARLSTNIKTLTITFIIDGGGAEIALGEHGHLEIPFACTINRVTMLADQSGSIQVDIWKDTYANFPPTDADSITASAVPTITTAQKSQDSTLTGWTTAIAAGDILAFYVDSVTDIERVTISLKVTKT